jgi:DNA-binding winged helix-turn-helix (wHTH) protein
MAAPPPLRFGPYWLDGASGQLWCQSQLVKLPPKATAVLWCLASQAGQVVAKATLLDTVWAETAVSEGVLAVCIRNLRRALGDEAKEPRYIETVHKRGYRFVAPVVALPEPPPGARPAARLAPSLAPGLVGRVGELAQVQACLGQALRGQRQVVLISGEAGLGKTTVVDAFLATLAPDPPVWVAWGQCLAHYGAGEAYLPVLDALGRLGRGPGHARLLGLLRQYAPTWVGQLPALFSAADLEAVQRQVLGATRERMLREAAEVLEAVSAAQPLVLVLEDLHWSDHATLDLLSWLARRRGPARLLVLGTYRPGDVLVHGHPLEVVKQDLLLHGQCVELRLAGLSVAEVQAYLRLQGELLLCQTVPDVARAEACFGQALTIARRQQAKSWELRAAMSLSRLWQQQGQRQAAYDLLAPIYDWFTEGFDTADLQEARALLHEPGVPHGAPAAGRPAVAK